MDNKNLLFTPRWFVAITLAAALGGCLDQARPSAESESAVTTDGPVGAGEAFPASEPDGRVWGHQWSTHAALGTTAMRFVMDSSQTFRVRIILTYVHLSDGRYADRLTVVEDTNGTSVGAFYSTDYVGAHAGDTPDTRRVVNDLVPPRQHAWVNQTLEYDFGQGQTSLWIVLPNIVAPDATEGRFTGGKSLALRMEFSVPIRLSLEASRQAMAESQQSMEGGTGAYVGYAATVAIDDGFEAAFPTGTVRMAGVASGGAGSLTLHHPAGEETWSFDPSRIGNDFSYAGAPGTYEVRTTWASASLAGALFVIVAGFHAVADLDELPLLPTL